MDKRHKSLGGVGLVARSVGSRAIGLGLGFVEDDLLDKAGEEICVALDESRSLFEAFVLKPGWVQNTHLRRDEILPVFHQLTALLPLFVGRSEDFLDFFQVDLGHFLEVFQEGVPHLALVCDVWERGLD